MEGYKTLAEIKAETTKKLYYRSFDMARAVALTVAAEELGAMVQSANPFICVERKGDWNRNISTADLKEAEDKAQFVLGLWARLIVNGETLYIQMNDNPFFSSYVSRRVIMPDKKTYRQHYIDCDAKINDRMCANVNWDNSPETIKTLTKNIKAEILRAIETPFTNKNSYVQEIPAYERKQEQIIYKY